MPMGRLSLGNRQICLRLTPEAYRALEAMRTGQFGELGTLVSNIILDEYAKRRSATGAFANNGEDEDGQE